MTCSDVHIDASVSFKLNQNFIDPNDSLKASWLIDTLSKNMEMFYSDVGDF